MGTIELIRPQTLLGFYHLLTCALLLEYLVTCIDLYNHQYHQNTNLYHYQKGIKVWFL